MERCRTLTLIAAFVAAQPVAGQNQVWVVAPNPGPGIQFTQIQAAVSAASDGDLILVRSGSYARFVVDGKSLRIAGDVGASVTVTNISLFGGGLVVRNISAGQRVLLRRMTLESLEIQDVQGAAWVED